MKRILAVDDSEVNLLLINSIFEDDVDIDIQIETDNLKALPMIRKGNYSVLILDLMMPVIDGFQILSEMANDKRLAEIPVIVISAMTPASVADKLNYKNVRFILYKPIDLKELEFRIRSILNLHLV